MANILSSEKRAQIVSCLIEGMGTRATARICGVGKNAVTALIVSLGTACQTYQEATIYGLKSQRVQMDEIWAFCGCKAKRVGPQHEAKGWGDIWTWLAIDADSKLLIAWRVGNRDGGTAKLFVADVAARLASRVQLTSDGHKPYLQAVEDAFGSEIDFAQLVKHYSGEQSGPEVKYSPARFIGASKTVVAGDPDPAHISTSFSERLNLTVRMGNRRFTRLTNAHSKKVENHGHSFALFAMHYNFCKVHSTLRVTPAMEAGLTDHVWEISEVIALLGGTVRKAA